MSGDTARKLLGIESEAILRARGGLGARGRGHRAESVLRA
jgi:hypothetical protein